MCSSCISGIFNGPRLVNAVNLNYLKSTKAHPLLTGLFDILPSFRVPMLESEEIMGTIGNHSTRQQFGGLGNVLAGLTL